jgi:Predicted pyridoxal phosphate-dependent enzyme apparently involved in regulation of cell wall biogenesis
MCTHDDDEARWIPWFIDIYVNENDRAALQQHLKALAIGTRLVYPAIHSQPAYKEKNSLTFPVTERFAARGLWLPSSSKLTDARGVARVRRNQGVSFATKRAKL